MKSCCQPQNRESLSKRLIDGGVIAIILFLLYAIVQELHLVPDINLSGKLNYLSVFILGLVASTSTCMATSGALFLATIGKLKKRKLDAVFFDRLTPTKSGPQAIVSKKTSSLSFIPVISFNLGRVLSYGFFGFVSGVIGSMIMTKFQFGSLLTLVVSLFMVLLGLDMARIISLGAIIPSRIATNIFEKLEHRLLNNPKKTAFFLGAITYLLPCGFTQTIQVYALGLASPVQSALTMITFALGTVPALFFISYISSFTQSKYYLYFMKVVGVLVFIIGLSYFGNFISLYGINLNIFSSSTQVIDNSNVAMKDGFQIATMTVDNSGYYPNVFTVKKGIPVKWVINGNNVFGCQGYLIVPKLGVQKALTAGENIIDFTPQEEGIINFSCGMGMYKGKFKVKS